MVTRANGYAFVAGAMGAFAVCDLGLAVGFLLSDRVGVGVLLLVVSGCLALFGTSQWMRAEEVE